MHQTRPSALFSPIFSGKTEKIGPPEARQKRPQRNESLQARLLILCARFFLSKPQTEFAVWVFSMQICDNLSVSASLSQHPYPFCPFGTFPPDRGNRPLEGEPLPPTTAVAEMVEVWYYDTITGEKETHYASDIRI